MNIQLDVTTGSEKKQAILESMLDLTDEHGLLGVPMSLLAKKAGVAAGTIYHYFDSKEAMILALFEYVKKTIDHEIFKLKDNSKDDYGKRFKSIWINLCQYFIDHPKTLNFMDQFFASPLHKIANSDESQYAENSFWNFFTRGIEEGHLQRHDIHIINSIFMGGLIVTVKKHDNGWFKVNRDQLETIADIIWNGLKK